MSTNWQTMEVRLDAGVSADQQYIWGLRFIDDLVVRDRTVTDPLDERIYAMQDVQWNVIALADASGDVVERFAYQPYGESQVHSSTYSSSSDSYHWQYRFTSREHDLDTGLDYFRNRYWHNLVGVFITRDPLEYVDGHNFYRGWFVPGNTDSSGKFIDLMPTDIHRAAPPCGPIVYEHCSTIAWLNGECCTQGQIDAFQQRCHKQGKILASATCQKNAPEKKGFNYYSCKENKRKKTCRCTIRHMPDPEKRRHNCPDRVEATVDEKSSIGVCQKIAKETAPQACRAFYGHCGWK